jgi:hypothetical protein
MDGADQGEWEFFTMQADQGHLDLLVNQELGQLKNHKLYTRMILE